MKDKKLQVFVSSTFTDLKEERQAAVEAILSTGNIPAGMELFAAGDETQMAVIKCWIEQSDVYLLILGGRYGSVEKKSGKSYTQLEFEYAVQTGKPWFAVVMDKEALEAKVKIHGTLILESENPRELKAFQETVTGSMVKFWSDKKDIKVAIHETLADFGERKDLAGWIRGDNVVNSSLLAEEIAKLTKENSELRRIATTNTDKSNALFASLTFDELKRLLEVDEVPLAEEFEDLFDYLTAKGDQFITAYRPKTLEDSDACKRLQVYKLIKNINTRESPHYKLTEDGHNFYLKALAWYET